MRSKNHQLHNPNNVARIKIPSTLRLIALSCSIVYFCACIFLKCILCWQKARFHEADWKIAAVSISAPRETGEMQGSNKECVCTWHEMSAGMIGDN